MKAFSELFTSGISIQEDIGGFGQFPPLVYLISMTGGRYAANNATTPDGGLVDGLACFSEREEADIYMEIPNGARGEVKSLRGEIVGVSFDEARVIAKQKQKLDSLLLFKKGKITEIHWIK
jgi:hypothetical protein